MPSDGKSLTFIDTCSLLVSCWDIRRNGRIAINKAKEARFWDKELASLQRTSEVILAKRNYDELVKLSKVHGDPKRPQLDVRCEYVLDKLRRFIDLGSISIVGDANDPFADAVLLSVALKFRTQYDMLFLTQDRDLANDLFAIADFQSVRPRGGQSLKVCRLSVSGAVEPWSPQGIHSFASSMNGRKKGWLQESNSSVGASGNKRWQ